MLHVIALICSISTPIPDCSRSTALDVIPLQRDATTPIGCMISGQEQVADAGVVDIKAGTYLKVVCERPRQATSRR